MAAADDSSHAEPTVGADTVEKLVTLPVWEAALLPAGMENGRAVAVPGKGGFGGFSVGSKRQMGKNG